MSWQFFLLFVVISLICQGYFTMMEMACLSFNRLRLQYYISQGDRKSIWLGALLNRPTYLFGTTLIGVNLFLQIGSECARLFYTSLGLNPDYAMISQVFLVMIFAELSPMFAARAHAEHVMRIGITPIYFLSKIFTPFIWILNGICLLLDAILKSPKVYGNYLTREELQKAIETKEIKEPKKEQKQLDSLVESIFALRGKTPKDLMIPLAKVTMVPFDATVKEAKAILHTHYHPFAPLYSKQRSNVFGIIYSRNLLCLEDDKYVKDIALSPWFITEKNSIFQVLKQFRWNNQHFAIVLDENGGATGMLTLDCIIDAMFESVAVEKIRESQKPLIIVDRAFPADTSIKEINEILGIMLPSQNEDTLEDLMTLYLGHSPQKLDAVRIRDFLLTMEETPFMADKTVRITSL